LPNSLRESTNSLFNKVKDNFSETLFATSSAISYASCSVPEYNEQRIFPHEIHPLGYLITGAGICAYSLLLPKKKSATKAVTGALGFGVALYGIVEQTLITHP
jgi:hypothetical protein